MLGSVPRCRGQSQASLCRHPGSSNTASRELGSRPGAGCVHPPRGEVFAKKGGPEVRILGVGGATKQV